MNTPIITYLPITPLAVPLVPNRLYVGRMRVAIGHEQRDGYVYLDRQTARALLTVRWLPTLWPVAIAQHMDENAILKTWMAYRAFYQWVRTFRLPN